MKKILIILMFVIFAVANAEWKNHIGEDKNSPMVMVTGLDQSEPFVIYKLKYTDDLEFYQFTITFKEELESNDTSRDVKVFYELDDEVFIKDGSIIAGNILSSILVANDNQDFINALKKSNKALIMFDLKNGKRIKKEVSLKGFTKAFNKMEQDYEKKNNISFNDYNIKEWDAQEKSMLCYFNDEKGYIGIIKENNTSNDNIIIWLGYDLPKSNFVTVTFDFGDTSMEFMGEVNKKTYIYIRRDFVNTFEMFDKLIKNMKKYNTVNIKIMSDLNLFQHNVSLKNFTKSYKQISK